MRPYPRWWIRAFQWGIFVCLFFIHKESKANNQNYILWHHSFVLLLVDPVLLGGQGVGLCGLRFFATDACELFLKSLWSLFLEFSTLAFMTAQQLDILGAAHFRLALFWCGWPWPLLNRIILKPALSISEKDRFNRFRNTRS